MKVLELRKEQERELLLLKKLISFFRDDVFHLHALQEKIVSIDKRKKRSLNTYVQYLIDNHLDTVETLFEGVVFYTFKRRTINDFLCCR